MSNPVRVRTIDQCPKQHPLPKPCRHSMDSQTSLAFPLKIATKKKRKEKKKKSLLSIEEFPELFLTRLFSAAAGFLEISNNSNDNSP